MPTPTPPIGRRMIPAIALGGGLGSLARYGISRAWTVHNASVPWSTLTINLVGSLLLGMLVVAVTEIWRPHPLLRPFLGTGVLGGFTTFSTFAVEVRGLPADHIWLYLALSVVGGLAAALAGMNLVRILEPRFSISETHGFIDPIDPDQP
jgi:CrcB protein